VLERFPSSRHAPLALFQLGLIDFVSGKTIAADSVFEALVRQHPNHPEALAARYWAGRSLVDLRDTARAHKLWREIIEKEPASYYSVLASKRLETRLPIPRGPSLDTVRFQDVDSAAIRLAFLRDAGFPDEARFEANHLMRNATNDNPARMRATAYALAAVEETSRAITLGWRVIEGGERSERSYRLVFPIVGQSAIIRASKDAGLDPIMVASLIRQESNFYPRAVSPVGARGLMQLMPDVARPIAASAGISPWSSDRLFEPEVNITLGVRHLRVLMQRYSEPVRALAAYNAGESRVARWSVQKGTEDPELFTERIPFVETRDYVRAILRNYLYYSRLYDW
jgi:soluble lytic murein transglycosylase